MMNKTLMGEIKLDSFQKISLSNKNELKQNGGFFILLVG